MHGWKKISLIIMIEEGVGQLTVKKKPVQDMPWLRNQQQMSKKFFWI